MTELQTRTKYAYDTEDRLTSAAGVTYSYDGNGLRVMKSSGTIDWRGAGGSTLVESNLSGVLQNEYIFFGGARIARRDSSGNVFYSFTDHLGSTRVVTNSTGTPCYEADFTPYGGELTPSGFSDTCSPNYRFTGYEYDSETQNDYAFARYYDSHLGRFLSVDPLDGSPGTSQSWNKYAYVTNNPLNFTDPAGMDGGDDNNFAFFGPILITPSPEASYSWWDWGSWIGGFYDQTGGTFTNIADNPSGFFSGLRNLINTFVHPYSGEAFLTRNAMVSAGQEYSAKLNSGDPRARGQAFGFATMFGISALLGESGSALRVGEIGSTAGISGIGAVGEDIKLGSAITWGRSETLADHFVRHGADFGASSAESYANEASSFFQRSQAEGLPTKIDANGVIRVYEPSTNTFGSFNSNGTTRTFFKPNPQNYFQIQPGKPIL